MKISSYYKDRGDDVELCTSYDEVGKYDQVFVSKVFTDTCVPEGLICSNNVHVGGTGFFYDKAPALPDNIEHIMPDYHLYDDFVKRQVDNGFREKEFIFYKDYSIGFLTRGCFRKCPFCVNKNYNKCVRHSPVNEFIDYGRRKIYFLDDNFLACKDYKSIINDVLLTEKRFRFGQGLDERLLNDEKINELMSWPYDGDYIFAFDNIEDKEIIEGKLKRIRELYPTSKKSLKFYVLCGYDRQGKYDDDFWIRDIADTFERIEILGKYRAFPYIMRYERSYKSKYNGMYANMASWCNQPRIFRTFSFREFCICRGMSNKYNVYKRDYISYLNDGYTKGKPWTRMEEFARNNPTIAEKYFDTKYGKDE